MQDLSLEAVGELYAKHHEGDDFESAFTNHFEGDLPEREYLARSWDDMRRFGFVSAGHGEKYRNAMNKLFEGARVWAEIPGIGYVGVGEVTAPAVAVNDFDVEVDGVTMPILQADFKAPNMGEEADDPEQSEYLARVRWLDTRPREQAVWEKGMFANQNVVAKLRQPFTLQRLAEVFRVPADENPG